MIGENGEAKAVVVCCCGRDSGEAAWEWDGSSPDERSSIAGGKAHVMALMSGDEVAGRYRLSAALNCRSASSYLPLVTR